MKRLQQTLLIAACISFGNTITHAQENARFTPDDAWRFRADDQASQQLYTLAAQAATQYLAQNADVHNLNQWQDEGEKARYICAITALKTDARGAEDSALIFLHETANVPLHDRLSLALAQYYFLHGRLADAIPYYTAAGIGNLSNAEIADAKFELAYCYFNNRRFDDAAPLFATMREVPGKYYTPGNYYYGLLAYNRGAYEDALKSFSRIENEPLYSPIVPYYMAEIQYYIGNRQKALSEALRLIKRSDKLYYDNELHLLAAQCLFEESRYGDALPYFEYYYEHTEKIRREELYEMGYCYYRVSEWKNAIDKFKPLSSAQDSLGQSAMYLLGDAYLKANNKPGARNAFGYCSGMKFNAGQREASLLLYGKLSYELGYFDDALRSATTLLSDYPGTKFSGDARLLQSQVFLASNNFHQAYETLAQPEVAGRPGSEAAMQRAAYGYALEQLREQHTNAADSLLSTSLRAGSQPVFIAAASFWKGDIAYRQHRYAEALDFSQKFLDNANGVSAVSPEATAAHAYLNMGYAALESSDFAAAQKYFSKAQSAGGNTIVTADASLREADALFMQKDFNRAAIAYAKTANGGGAGSDYARLQLAIVSGLQGKTEDKIRLLQTVMNSTPPSRYAGDARYELGVTTIERGQYAEAITLLHPLTTGNEYRMLAPKSLLKTAIAYQQLGQQDKAIETYRQIVTTYPSSTEHKDALAALKSMYIERNQPDAYVKLLRDNNLPAAADNELDSAYYSAAEAQFAAGQWNAAQQGFSRYVQQFPAGSFAVRAHYYSGESYDRQKEYNKALPEYDAVLQSGAGEFSETAALHAAHLAASMNDTAAEKYDRLLLANTTDNNNKAFAWSGIMRIAARAGRTPEAALYADSLLTLPNNSAETTDEAKLYRARQLMADNRTADAIAIFKELQTSKWAPAAAEARYHLAETMLAEGKLKEAEDAAGKNVKLSAGNDYWVVRSYILLGDILTKEHDYFNAKATLQSVIDHSKDEALKAEAARKLEEVKAQESSKLSNE